MRPYSCKRKIRHSSFIQADKHAKGIGDKWLLPYKCKYCGGFHVGHANDKLKSKIKKRKARKHGHKV